MRTVWKFDAPVTDTISFMMPVGAQVLSVGSQASGTIALWALVDSDSDGMKMRTFAVVGTGNSLDFEGGRFVGTVMDGPFVWHIFEVG